MTSDHGVLTMNENSAAGTLTLIPTSATPSTSVMSEDSNGGNQSTSQLYTQEYSIMLTQ